MRSLRTLLSVLNDTLDECFQQGPGEEALFRKLHQRLSALRLRSRRLSTVGTGGFLAAAAALILLPFLLDTAGLPYRALSLVLGVFLVGAGMGALEASKLVVLIDALEDMLVGGPAMGPLDVLLVIRNGVQAELTPEPRWEPMVAIFAAAYETSASARATLLAAGIPIFTVNLSQPPIDIWREALRVAYRSKRLPALLSRALADDSIAAFHDPLRDCRAALGV
jgi:hypothetical protein